MKLPQGMYCGFDDIKSRSKKKKVNSIQTKIEMNRDYEDDARVAKKENKAQTRWLSI